VGPEAALALREALRSGVRMDQDFGDRHFEILLVEDNPGDVRLTQEAFKEGKLFNNLHVAVDGEQAVSFLRRNGAHREAPRPDLVLLDLNLPKKDGREVLAEMKHDRQLRSIPVVVLTTSKDSQDIKHAYDLNCNCYITKPIDLDRFIDVLRTIDRFWLGIVSLPYSDKTA
jgi:chemotaxis family two-component system response regulator Rcp1